MFETVDGGGFARARLGLAGGLTANDRWGYLLSFVDTVFGGRYAP